MLKSPKLGMKKQTIERILLKEENRPQTRIIIVDVNGTNCFSDLIPLRWRLKQLFKVIAIDIPSITVGFIGIPRIEVSFRLKTASSPPVVFVIVKAKSRRRI